MSKNYCEKHHFSYTGFRCPYCEKDRIGGLAHRFKRAIVEEEVQEPKEEPVNENLDWEDLAGKFNITTKK